MDKHINYAQTGEQIFTIHAAYHKMNSLQQQEVLDQLMGFIEAECIRHIAEASKNEK
jgi:hypothetical protein